MRKPEWKRLNSSSKAHADTQQYPCWYQHPSSLSAPQRELACLCILTVVLLVRAGKWAKEGHQDIMPELLILQLISLRFVGCSQFSAEKLLLFWSSMYIFKGKDTSAKCRLTQILCLLTLYRGNLVRWKVYRFRASSGHPSSSLLLMSLSTLWITTDYRLPASHRYRTVYMFIFKCIFW